jgi:23S rRNA pseudouridine2605 synthase
MPRDNDRDSRRPPGRRGPPPRGGGGKRPGGGFRKDGDSRRGEGRSSRPATGRSGDKRSEGDKRPYAGKSASFRKDGERPARREFNRDGDRPPRREFKRDGDRPPRREFKGEGDRPPRREFKGEGDRPPRREFKRDGERPPRREFKRDGDRPPRREFKRDGERPQRREFNRDGDRPPRRDFKRDGERAEGRPPRRDFNDRKAAGDKPWQSRSSAPRGDFKRSDRPDRDSRGERSPPREGGKRFERPRGDRPFRDKRDDRRGGRPEGDRPRFSRDRSDRPQDDRPRPARPRNDRGPRTSHAWREHPASEAPDEQGERSYTRRPAFGGRGEYRERTPERDVRKRETVEAAPAKPKKDGDRIAKLMARAGLCSRRDAEVWIREGRVTVNGRVITSPALDVTAQDTVLVDGAPLPERERTRLFLYHKPKGLVTTHADPEGRPTVFDSLPDGLPRLISIGRLDFNTEGLLLLTNDGGLARVLELPDTGWLRRYRVRAHGTIEQEKLDELRKGVEVEGVKYGPIEATLERDQGANVWILFAIREGKNREVRNVMTHLGLDVNRLIRVSYGPFQLGELPEGEVQEVRSRLLRDQLGERIAAAAQADFGLPTRDSDEAETSVDAVEKPRRRGVIADRKGRRVLVERSARDDGDDDRPRRKPGSGYKGKRDRAPRED